METIFEEFSLNLFSAPRMTCRINKLKEIYFGNHQHTSVSSSSPLAMAIDGRVSQIRCVEFSPAKTTYVAVAGRDGAKIIDIRQPNHYYQSINLLSMIISEFAC